MCVRACVCACADGYHARLLDQGHPVVCGSDWVLRKTSIPEHISGRSRQGGTVGRLSQLPVRLSCSLSSGGGLRPHSSASPLGGCGGPTHWDPPLVLKTFPYFPGAGCARGTSRTGVGPPQVVETSHTVGPRVVQAEHHPYRHSLGGRAFRCLGDGSTHRLWRVVSTPRISSDAAEQQRKGEGPPQRWGGRRN